MTDIYTPQTIEQLELGWGHGWLSPGGPDEVRHLLEGVDIAGKSVLDVGVGTGSPATLLLTEFEAGHVIGIDVEQGVIERARLNADAQKVGDRLNLIKVTSGPLPLDDKTFEVIFSKDSFVHIADKATLFVELFRLLCPGGVCVFSDWCCGPPQYSAEMLSFLQNGMEFSMCTTGAYQEYLAKAGFVDLFVRDRNTWLANIAEDEHAAFVGPLREQMVKRFGVEAADRMAASAARRAIISRQGHLRPTHFRATKPLED